MIERDVENILEQDLIKNGYIINVGEKGRNVWRQTPRTDDQKTSLNGKFPDFIIYESDEVDSPIAIVETKRPEHKTLENAKDQGMYYAKCLNSKFMFLFNGNRYIAYHVPSGKNLLIDNNEVESLLTLEQLKKFNSHSYFSRNKAEIKSKSDLIDVFKTANNKLREAGVTIGISRFTEFSNLLFLKLLSELNEINSYNISSHLLWDQYRDFEGETLLNYINNTVIVGLNSRFDSNDSNPLFTPLIIKDTVKLKEIINKLDTLNLASIDTDIKGDAFEYFIQKYNSSNNDLGEYFTPRHLVKFLNTIIKPKYGDKIYDPFCGTGGMLIEAYKEIYQSLEISGQLDEINLLNLRTQSIWGGEISVTARIAKMNMILSGDGHSNIKQHDSFSNPVSDKFDVVISNIPFNMEVTDQQASNYLPVIKSGNAVALLHIIKSLKKSSPNARAAVIVPESVLNDSVLVDLRKELVKERLLKGVISLPAKVFLPYTEAKTSILILGGYASPKQEKIFFFRVKNDGFTLTTRRRPMTGINDLDEFIAIHNQMISSNYSCEVSHPNLQYVHADDIIKQKDKSLLLFKYDDSTKEGYIKLSSILEKRRIKNNNLYPTASITKSEFWGMPLGEDLWGENFFSVTSNNTENYSVVKNGWISFNPSRANVGSFGININEEALAVTSAYPVFECISEKYSPQYIYLMLTRNKEVTEEIINRSFGTVRQSLSSDDFLSIQIPDLPIEKQLEIVKHANQIFDNYQHAKSTIESYQL